MWTLILVFKGNFSPLAFGTVCEILAKPGSATPDSVHIVVQLFQLRDTRHSELDMAVVIRTKDYILLTPAVSYFTSFGMMTLNMTPGHCVCRQPATRLPSRWL